MDMSGVTSKVEEAGFLSKAGGITVWNGRIHQFSFRTFGYDRPALHVERDEFDHILLKHSASCGTQVFEEINVTGVDFAGDKPVVQYSSLQEDSRGTGRIQCRYVVDASGNSTVNFHEMARQAGFMEDDFVHGVMAGKAKILETLNV